MKTLVYFNRFVVISTLILAIGVRTVCAQERPFILADAQERVRVLGLIGKYDWAANYFNNMQNDMAPLIMAHKEDPAKSLGSAPEFGVSRVHPHINWMKEAVQAGTLYFMTGDEDYAQFAADRLNPYVQFLGAEEGVVAVVSSDGKQRDYRDVHENIALCYDYIQPFLMKDSTVVFDASTGNRIPFDGAKAQLMFQNIVEYGFKECDGGSNITIMEADGVMYPALCIENKEKRDAYVKACVEGWTKNTGVRWMKNVLVENKGTWPESASYSGVGYSIPIYMDIIDRLYPEYRIFDGFEEAFLGAALNRRFFVYPNETEQLSFGDAHRIYTRGDRLEDYTQIMRRVGFEEVAEVYFGQLKADREKYGYTPTTLWAMDPIEDYQAKPFESQASHLPYAGILIQKNLHFTDPKLHGLMYYTGGANYIHSQLSGLDMELYGAGCVMSGVGGTSVHDRGSDIVVNYYRIFAGHNTVVVNGKSVGSRKGWKGYWNGWMDPVELLAAEPMPNAPPVSKNFTFSSQRLNDLVNNSEQQRTVSIVRTSDTSGYYIDFFRSRSNEENEFHDYIYHNIGDGLSLMKSDGDNLELNPVEDRYQKSVELPSTDGTRIISFPGWKYFTDVETSPLTSEMISGTFNIDLMPNGKRYMHVAMPGDIEREYTSAAAPPISEAAGGYDDKESRVLSIRQPGEAWDRPFTVVFEPSLNEKPTVKSVHPIYARNKVVGAEVRSVVPYTAVTDYVIANDNDKETFILPSLNISFEGRFGIVRIEKRGEKERVTLYIGDGKSIKYGPDTLVANEKNQGLKIIGELDPIIEERGTKKKIEIEAEDYDVGGEGVAYHDLDIGNREGGYRNEDVDITADPAASNSHAVSFFKPGEWMRYTFQADSSCYYEMNYVASNRNNDSASINFYLNDSLLFGGPVYVKRTNNWNIYESNIMPDSVYLEKGLHILKIVQGTSSNPDKVVFQHGSDSLINDTVTNARPDDVPNAGYFLTDIVELFVASVNGTVSISPEQEQYFKGTELILEATPLEGCQFDGWSGDLTSVQNPLTITMNSIIHLTANFSLITSLNQTEYSPDVNVYPNPSKGVFTVSVPSSSTNGFYRVYSLSGMKVREGFISGQFEIDMDAFANGIYFLTLCIDKEVVWQKIVLEK